MNSLPPPVAALAAALRKLPGIGPRSAERIALHLVQTGAEDSRNLAETLLLAREKTRPCGVCGALTEQNPCPVCENPRRDAGVLCVVEHPADVISLEKSGGFQGKYHVLGGKISPMNGVEPEDLRIGELESRLARETIRELIIALGTDVEGDATSHYLARRFSGRGVKISRIAHGLPAGSGLDMADDVTLSRALEGRREMT